MSTRGLVRVKDAAAHHEAMLYSASDSYPSALGMDIYDFVNRHPVAPLGVRDYAMQLLNGNIGLEYIHTWDDRLIDWVYDVIIGGSKEVVLQVREVDWSDRKEGSQLERLGDPKDFSDVIAAERVARDIRFKHHKDLISSIGECPVCGAKGVPDSCPCGVRIMCKRDACSLYLPKVRYPDLETAVAKWNQFAAMCGGLLRVES